MHGLSSFSFIWYILSEVVILVALIGLAIYAKGATRVAVVVAFVLDVIGMLIFILSLLRWEWPSSVMQELMLRVVSPVVGSLFILILIVAVILAIRDARVASRRGPAGQPSYPGFAGPTYPQQGYPPSGAPQPGQRRNP